MKKYAALLGSNSHREVLKEGLLVDQYYSIGGCIFDIENSQQEAFKAINKVLERGLKPIVVIFKASGDEVRQCGKVANTYCLVKDLGTHKIQTIYELNKPSFDTLDSLFYSDSRTDYVCGYKVLKEYLDKETYDIELVNTNSDVTVAMSIVSKEIDGGLELSIQDSLGKKESDRLASLDTMWIHTLYVGAEVRGCNVGSSLIDYLIETEKIKGTNSLSLEVSPFDLSNSKLNTIEYNKKQSALIDLYMRHGLEIILDSEYVHPKGRRMVVMSVDLTKA